MGRYANKFFQEYIPESDLEGSIKKDNPVPTNKNKSNDVYDFIYTVLGKNHSCLRLDSNYNRIQKKVIGVTGRLGMLWSELENLKFTIRKQPQFKVPVEEFTTFVEKTLLLLKQALGVGRFIYARKRQARV